jgi:hypothetical protein
MKKLSAKVTIIAIVAWFMMSLNAYSQTSLVWGRQFGSDKEEYAMNHVADAKGNIFIAGKTTGNMDGINAGANDIFLTRFDNSGLITWTRQIGSSGDEDTQWSAIDQDGNIYITGSTTGVLKDKNYGNEDVFVVKYDSSGQMKWVKQYGTDSTDIGKGICTDTEGFVYVSGMTLGKMGNSALGKSDGFLMKLDAEGKPLFVNQFGTASDDFSNAITATGSFIYVCGSTWGDLGAKNKGFMDVFTGQFSEDGKLVSFNQCGSESFEIAMDLKVDHEGNIYVGGSTSGNMGCQQIGEGDCFLAKLDKKGKLLWCDQFGTPLHDGIRSIDLNDKIPGHLLVSGLLNLPPAQAFIRLYKKDGKLDWERKFVAEGANGESSGKDVSMDNQGYIYHIGLTGSNLFGDLIGGHDVFLVKLKLEKEYMIR